MKKILVFLSLSLLGWNLAHANIGVLSMTPTVNGACNGSVTIEATGTAGPFTLVVHLPGGGQQTFGAFTGQKVITGLCAGVHQIDVINNLGCAKTLSPQIPCTFSMNTATSHVCGAANGSITITPTGGTAPYTYAWTRPNGTTATGNPLSASTNGLYNVTVTDAQGCVASTQVQFTKNVAAIVPDFNTAATITPACSGGTAGGAICLNVDETKFFVSWPTLNKTGVCVTNLAAGNYCVKLTDIVCGNIYYRCFNVGTGTSPTRTLQESVNNICGNSTQKNVCINVSGGRAPFTYLWSNSATTSCVSAPSGNITVTVTDLCGSSTKTINVPSSTVALAVPTVDALTKCPGGLFATATVTGGAKPYQYEWFKYGTSSYEKLTDSPNTPTLSGATVNNRYSWGNNFKVKVTDACNQTAEKIFPAYIASGGTDFDLSLTTGAAGSCEQTTTTAEVTVSGGVNPNNIAITWDRPYSGPGTYTVKGFNTTANQACGEIVTFTIENYVTPPTFKYTTTPAAAGVAQGSITLSVSGLNQPYSFAWSNSRTTQSISNVVPGNYCVTITYRDWNDNNCSKSMCITIPTTPSGSFQAPAELAQVKVIKDAQVINPKVLEPLKDPFISKVFPNPFQDVFIVEVEGNTARKYVIQVHNALGQLILRQEIEGVPGLNRQEIRPKSAPGVLYVEVSDELGNRSTHKLISP